MDGVGVSNEPTQDLAPTIGTTRNGIGTLLREAREQRGIDIEGVARALRIRHPYLVAIEEGRYKDLPGAPYASGFVRSYAEFLGLDATEILRRFREESGGAGARTELIFPAPVSEGGFPAAVLIGLVIILAAVVYGVWYFYQWRHSGSAESVSELPERLAALIHSPNGDDGSGKSPSQAMAAGSPAMPAPSAQFASTTKPDAPQAQQTVQPAPVATPATTPALASAPAASPTPIPTPAPVAVATAEPPQASPAATPVAEPTPVATAATSAPATTASATPSPPADTPKPAAEAETTPPPAVVATNTPPPAPDMTPPSRVVLRATDDCWIEIRDSSGEVVISRLLHRGDAFPVPPRAGETLTVGNAGAIALLLDGSPLPPLGKAGMVRHDVPIDPEHLTGQPPAAQATN